MHRRYLQNFVCFLCILFILTAFYPSRVVAKVFNFSDDPCGNLVASWTIDILNAVPLFYKLPRRLPTNERYLTVDKANKLIEQAKDNELKNFVQEILFPKQIENENIPIFQNPSSRDSIFFTGLRCPIKTEIIFINPSSEELTATINCGNDEVTCAAIDVDRRYGLGERRKKYLIETVAASLANSSTFKVAGEKLKTQDLPKSMIKFVQKEFNSLINQLSSNDKKKLKNAKIDVNTSSKELWLRSNTMDKIVTISPALLRAIFILTLKDDCPRCIFFSSKEDLAKAYRGTSQKEILDDFSKQLHFVLGHEIGHLLLTNTNNGSNPTEEECDDVGANLAKKLDKNLYLRTFSILVVNGISEQNSSWGFEATEDIRQVKIRLDRLKEKFGE